MFVEFKQEIDLGAVMNRKRYIVKAGERMDVRDDIAFRLVSAGHARPMMSIEVEAFRRGIGGRPVVAATVKPLADEGGK